MISITNPPEPPQSNPAIWPASLLAMALLLGVYLLTFNGLPVSDDEQLFLVLAQSVAERGQLDAAPLWGNARLQGQTLALEPGLPVIGALVYALLPALGIENVPGLMLINLYFGAATGGLLVALTHQLGARPKVAVLTGLLYGLGTLAWPYALTFYRETPATFFLVLALWLGVLGYQNRHVGVLIGAGVALAAALLTKIALILAVPALLVLGLPKWVARWGWLKVLAAIGVGGGLVAVALGVLGAIDPLFYRYSPLYLADVVKQILQTSARPPLWASVWAGFFSPGKGLLVYSPVVILALVAGLWRGSGRWVWLAAWGYVALTLAVEIALYPNVWWTVSWGLRFLLPTLPLLSLAALPSVDWLMAQPRGGLVLGGLLAIGVGVQLAAVLVPWQVYDFRLFFSDPQQLPIGVTAWAQSPLVVHLQALFDNQVGLAVLWSRIQAPLVVVGLVLIGAVIVGCIFSLQHPTWRKAGVLLGLAVVLPLGAVRSLNPDTAFYSQRADLQAAIVTINGLPPTTVVVLPAYLSPAWQAMLNRSRPAAQWYSLTPGSAPALDPASADLLAGPLTQAPGGCLLVDRSLADQQQHWLLAELNTQYSNLTPTRYSEWLTLWCFGVNN